MQRQDARKKQWNCGLAEEGVKDRYPRPLSSQPLASRPPVLLKDYAA